MAIYSRRILQRLINENAQFLLERQTKKHVQLLNRMSKDLTLAYEWEVVLLNALSKVGKVLHERNFGGRRTADIYFEAFNNPKANFVADITAISDKGVDENNPYEALSNMLQKLVKESGLRANSFNLRVGRHPGLAFKGGPKVRLKLPGRARFSQTIFGKDFEMFIHRILENPLVTDRHEVKTVDADVEISYIPNQRYASGGYSSYTQLYSMTDNPVYQALENKASQLLGTDFRGPLGIFLCDGGSSIFSRRSTAGLSYSIDDVIRCFLANHEEIQFVVTYTTGRKNPYATFSHGHNPFITHIRFYDGPRFNQVAFDLKGTLKRMEEQLPVPESEPRNALYWLKGRNPDVGRSNWGGMELNLGQKTTEVRISARNLAELLAGKVDQREFFEAHRFSPSELCTTHAANPFSVALQRGQLIHGISIERSESEDDDWITFELKGPDPAISPFKVPPKGEKSV